MTHATTGSDTPQVVHRHIQLEYCLSYCMFSTGVVTICRCTNQSCSGAAGLLTCTSTGQMCGRHCMCKPYRRRRACGWGSTLEWRVHTRMTSHLSSPIMLFSSPKVGPLHTHGHQPKLSRLRKRSGQLTPAAHRLPQMYCAL